MKKIELKPGDVFCTTAVGGGNGWGAKMISAAIRRVTEQKSSDGHAWYTHAGIITSPQGGTFEARWKYNAYHIDDYIGGPVLIGRPVNMTIEDHVRGLHATAKFKGRRYPLWRLLVFLLGMEEISLTGLMVCSELVCYKLMASGIDEVGEWQGQTPDDVADMINKWDAFEVVHETQAWPGIGETA